MAVRCGLSWAEVQDHSLAQLKLLDEAARRQEARRDAAAAQMIYSAAAAAFVGKEASRKFVKLIEQMQADAQRYRSTPIKRKPGKQRHGQQGQH